MDAIGMGICCCTPMLDHGQLLRVRNGFDLHSDAFIVSFGPLHLHMAFIRNTAHVYKK